MLYDEVLTYLRGAGFRLVGVSPGFWDRHTGEILQFDATFARSESPPPL